MKYIFLFIVALLLASSNFSWAQRSENGISKSQSSLTQNHYARKAANAKRARTAGLICLAAGAGAIVGGNTIFNNATSKEYDFYTGQYVKTVDGPGGIAGIMLMGFGGAATITGIVLTTIGHTK